MEGKRTRAESGQASVYDQVYGSWGRPKWQAPQAVEHVRQIPNPASSIHSQSHSGASPRSPPVFFQGAAPSTSPVGSHHTFDWTVGKQPVTTATGPAVGAVYHHHQEKFQRLGPWQSQSPVPPPHAGPSPMATSPGYSEPQYGAARDDFVPAPPSHTASLNHGGTQVRVVPSSSASVQHAGGAPDGFNPGSYAPSPPVERPWEFPAVSSEWGGTGGHSAASSAPLPSRAGNEALGYSSSMERGTWAARPIESQQNVSAYAYPPANNVLHQQSFGVTPQWEQSRDPPGGSPHQQSLGLTQAPGGSLPHQGLGMAPQWEQPRGMPGGPPPHQQSQGPTPQWEPMGDMNQPRELHHASYPQHSPPSAPEYSFHQQPWGEIDPRHAPGQSAPPSSTLPNPALAQPSAIAAKGPLLQPPPHHEGLARPASTTGLCEQIAAPYGHCAALPQQRPQWGQADAVQRYSDAPMKSVDEGGAGGSFKSQPPAWDVRPGKAQEADAERLRGGNCELSGEWTRPTAGAGESKPGYSSRGGAFGSGEAGEFSNPRGYEIGGGPGGGAARGGGVEGGTVEGEENGDEPRCRAGTVFVWDLDETLIIFQSLMSGKFVMSQGGRKSDERARALAKVWERLILNLSDTYMFFNQIEEWDQPSVGTLAPYDDGADLSTYDFHTDGVGPPTSLAARRKLAYRFRLVQEVYSKGLTGLLKENERQEWEELYRATDEYTEGWLSGGRRALLGTCSADDERMASSDSCTRASLTGGIAESSSSAWERKNGAVADAPAGAPSGNINVLVTSGQLIPTLAKCLLFRLDNFFTATEVYSSRDVGKLQCFQWIKERYAHTGRQFCAIGDGPDERTAADHIGWPFVKVALGPIELRIQNLTMTRIQEAIARAEEIERLKKRLSA